MTGIVLSPMTVTNEIWDIVRLGFDTVLKLSDQVPSKWRIATTC